MNKFAPVLPPSLAKAIGLKALGNYHLLLAHDVAKSSQRQAYIDAYGDRNYASTIIMDNSVVELGGAVNLDIVRAAVDVVAADVVVLPDAYLDGEATLKASLSAYDEWIEIFTNQRFCDLMFVPQGKSWKEFVACAEESLAMPKVRWWGIPRNMLTYVSSRRDAIELCRMLAPHRKIHLLGFSDNPCDDILCARSHMVQGIDSAVPLRFKGNWSITSDAGPRGNWWEEPDLSSAGITQSMINLARVQRYIGRFQ